MTSVAASVGLRSSSNLGCIFCFRRTGSLCISSGLPPRALPRLQLRRRASTNQGLPLSRYAQTPSPLAINADGQCAGPALGEVNLFSPVGRPCGQSASAACSKTWQTPPVACCFNAPAVHTLLLFTHLSLLHAGEHSASAACSSPSAACCSNAPSSDRKPSIARPSAAASSCATCPKIHRKHTQDMLYIYLYWL